MFYISLVSNCVGVIKRVQKQPFADVLRLKLWGNCAFPKSFHPRKLGEITVFYAVFGMCDMCGAIKTVIKNWWCFMTFTNHFQYLFTHVCSTKLLYKKLWIYSWLPILLPYTHLQIIWPHYGLIKILYISGKFW